MGGDVYFKVIVFENGMVYAMGRSSTGLKRPEMVLLRWWWSYVDRFLILCRDAEDERGPV